MNHSISILMFACATLLLVAAEQSSERQQRSVTLEPKIATPARPVISKRADEHLNQADWQDNNIPDEQLKHNDNETRLSISEPYKSILQTTTRFALAQSRVTKHVNIDTAMNFLNEAAHFLSKPVVLLKTLKVALITFATILATVFLFPGAQKIADLAWQDPMNAFNFDRYLTNGLQQRSVIEMLGSKTDETLSRVGLQDYSCRQRSLCYLGEIAKCSFPRTADTITKFMSDNFSESSVKDNIYAHAFISGFVDRNCTGIGATTGPEAHNCLGNFFNSLMSGGSK